MAVRDALLTLMLPRLLVGQAGRGGDETRAACLGTAASSEASPSPPARTRAPPAPVLLPPHDCSLVLSSAFSARSFFSSASGRSSSIEWAAGAAASSRGARQQEGRPRPGGAQVAGRWQHSVVCGAYALPAERFTLPKLRRAVLGVTMMKRLQYTVIIVF